MRFSTFLFPLSTFHFAVMAVSVVAAVSATAVAAEAKKPQELLRDLQNISRDKNATLEAVSNAYAAVTSLTNINARERGEAAKQFVNAHVAKGNLAAAMAFAEASAGNAALPVDARAALFGSVARSYADGNKRDTYGAYRHDGFDRAGELYGRIVSIPDATPGVKVEAYRNMANMRLEATRDIPGAFALLDKAIALPGIEPDQKARAVFNKADLHSRIGEYDKAIALLAPLVADESLPSNFRRDAFRKSLSVIRSQGGAEAELKARREALAKKDKYGNPFVSEGELASFCVGNGVDIPWAISYYRKAIANWEPNPGGRGFPDIGQIQKAYSASGYDAYAKEMPAVISKIAGSPSLLGHLFGAMIGRDAGPASRDERYPETILAFFDSVPATNRPAIGRLFDYASKIRQTSNRAVAYAREIGKLPEDSKAVNKDQRKNAAIFVALSDANGNGARAVTLLNAYLKKNPPADNLGRADFLLKGVRRAMTLRQDDVAKAIYAEREKLVRKEEPRSLPCPFIENAPQDISAILSSSFYKNGKKGLADRKFGDDLKFIIETDVTAKRDMTEFNGKPFRPTEIFAFCDAKGVKVMLRAFYDKETLEKFRNGFGGVGGYEAYIAPGIDGPYTFLGFGPGSTRLDSSFITQYDNGNGYRNFKGEDDSLMLSHYVADDSFISLLSFSWAKAFESLPSNGDKWYFEPLCWSQGGWSWGGSKGVHNRSNFGALVFDGITPKAAAAIRRIVLKKASDTYWNAKSARSNGCIEFWKDPVLGDPAFYTDCLKPLVARLDPYAGRVKPTMTDEDVMDVYEHAAKEWMNIDFIVSSLRERYVERTLIEEAGF